MSKIKLAVMYYSATGGNYQISKWVEEAAKNAGAEVRRRKFKETAPREAIEGNDAWKAFVDEHGDEKELNLEDLEWADAYFFCVPTRYGNLPSQVQAFIDTTGGLWFNGKLADKAATASSTAMNVHGGQEATLLSMYKTLTHWGCILVPPGYTAQEYFAAGGNPYGSSASVDQQGQVQDSDQIRAAIEKQTERLLDVAAQLKK